MAGMIFTDPHSLSCLMDIPADTTPWPSALSNEAEPYVTVTYNSRNRQISASTPNRARAPFSIGSAAILRNTTQAQAYANKFGIILLAFGAPIGKDAPPPALHIGFASNSGNGPEGIVTRVARHRINATGSHVGSRTVATNGIDFPHTTHGGNAVSEAWQDYAVQRYKWHFDKKCPDVCADARISVGEFTHTDRVANKNELYFIVHRLVKVDELRFSVINFLWPEYAENPSLIQKNPPKILTTSTRNGKPPLQRDVAIGNTTYILSTQDPKDIRISSSTQRCLQ